MPSSERISNAAKRLRSPVAIAVAAIAVLVVVGLLIKQDSPEGGLPIDPAIKVQAADRPARDVRLATDGDVPDDNAPVWVFGTAGGRTDVSLVRVTGERAGRRQEVPATVATPRGDEVLDVARWDPNRAREDLFRILPTAGGADVSVERLDQGGGRIAGGSAPLPQLPAGATREFAIATYSGTRPDLFVIDRGLDSERGRVQVLSGESGFAQTLVDNRLPVAGLDPERWNVDVGRALAPTDVTVTERPDIVMVLRDGSQGGQPELHVISGESGYKAFALQRTFALSEQLEADSRFLFGAIVGGSAIYAVEPRRGEPLKIRPITFQPPGQVV